MHITLVSTKIPLAIACEGDVLFGLSTFGGSYRYVAPLSSTDAKIEKKKVSTDIFKSYFLLFLSF